MGSHYKCKDDFGSVEFSDIVVFDRLSADIPDAKWNPRGQKMIQWTRNQFHFILIYYSYKYVISSEILNSFTSHEWI